MRTWFAYRSVLAPHVLGLPLTVHQIPDKELDSDRPAEQPTPSDTESTGRTVVEEPEQGADEFHDESEGENTVPAIRPLPTTQRRRLSTYESSDSVLDLEDDEIGGSARPQSHLHVHMGTPRSR